MSPEKLAYMANQIGRFFAHEGEKASASIADHLRMFWDPRMRAAIIAHLRAGGLGLNPPVRRAVERLAESSGRGDKPQPPAAGGAAPPAGKP